MDTTQTPAETKPPHEVSLERLRHMSAIAYDVMSNTCDNLVAHYLKLEREELAQPQPNPVLIYAYQAAVRDVEQRQQNIRWGDQQAVEDAIRQWSAIVRYARKDKPPLNEHDRSPEAQALIDQGYSEEQAAYLLLSRGRTPELMESMYPGMRESVFPDGVPAV